MQTFNANIEGFSAELEYYFTYVPSDKSDMYQNVNRARYSFDISGMTDAEKYNAYKIFYVIGFDISAVNSLINGTIKLQLILEV